MAKFLTWQEPADADLVPEIVMVGEWFTPRLATEDCALAERDGRWGDGFDDGQTNGNNQFVWVRWTPDIGLNRSFGKMFWGMHE